jgi:hypothetical protein
VRLLATGRNVSPIVAHQPLAATGKAGLCEVRRQGCPSIWQHGIGEQANNGLFEERGWTLNRLPEKPQSGNMASAWRQGDARTSHLLTQTYDR